VGQAEALRIYFGMMTNVFWLACHDSRQPIMRTSPEANIHQVVLGPMNMSGGTFA